MKYFFSSALKWLEKLLISFAKNVIASSTCAMLSYKELLLDMFQKLFNSYIAIFACPDDF